MRIFIAALLPEEVKAAVGEYIRVLKPRCEGVRWEIHDNLHITLKFLGSVDDTRVAQVSSLIGNIVRNYHPFEMSVLNFGGFPDLGNPRILYIGLSENPDLSSLESGMEEELEPLGFPKETHRFIPHVTIGRIKSRLGIKEPLPVPEKCKFTIGEVGVIKSETGRDGSVYTPLDLFRLR